MCLVLIIDLLFNNLGQVEDLSDEQHAQDSSLQLALRSAAHAHTRAVPDEESRAFGTGGEGMVVEVGAMVHGDMPCEGTPPRRVRVDKGNKDGIDVDSNNQNKVVKMRNNRAEQSGNPPLPPRGAGRDLTGRAGARTSLSRTPRHQAAKVCFAYLPC